MKQMSQRTFDQSDTWLLSKTIRVRQGYGKHGGCVGDVRLPIEVQRVCPPSIQCRVALSLRLTAVSNLAALCRFAITAFVPSVATIALSLRRLGEMMKEQKETVGLQISPGTNQYSGQVIPKPDLPPSLASAGIDKNLAHRIIRINQTINTATIPIAIMVVIQSIAIQPIAKRGNRVPCFLFPQ
jgi:hypothetical protein